MFVVGSLTGRAVEHLDECVTLPAIAGPEYTGDDSQTVSLGRID
jgi:hypothetical protein